MHVRAFFKTRAGDFKADAASAAGDEHAKASGQPAPFKTALSRCCGAACGHQSIFAPDAAMTLAVFSISTSMKAANSAGVEPKIS